MVCRDKDAERGVLAWNFQVSNSSRDNAMTIGNFWARDLGAFQRSAFVIAEHAVEGISGSPKATIVDMCLRGLIDVSSPGIRLEVATVIRQLSH